MNRLRLLSISISVERFMRKWYLPATVLGIGGLGVVGVLIGTERGRAVIRRVAENFIDAPESFEEWNDSALRELESIQSALDSLSQALGVRPAAQ
jgi:hypothetical protein